MNAVTLSILAIWLLLMGLGLLAVSWSTIPRRCRRRTVLTVLSCNLAGVVAFGYSPSVWSVGLFAVVYCVGLVWASEGFRRRRTRLPWRAEESSRYLSASGIWPN